MRRVLVVLSGLVAGAVAATAVGWAADGSAPAASALYVSPEGSDDNDGSEGAPFQTIQQAADTASPGTTVHVAPGTYGDDLTTTNPGSPDGWIRFVSDTAHGAKITGIVLVTSEYTSIEGFEITNPENRFGMDVMANNTLIKGNAFHDLHKFDATSDGGAGVTVYVDDYGPMENVVVDGNHVYDIGLAPGDNETVQGIYIAVPCEGCQVTNNLVHQIADFGIHAYHNPESWIVANNTVFGNGRGILSGTGFTVVNNISGDNLTSDYDIRDDATVSTNLSFGEGSEELPGVTVGDPQFVDYQTDGSGDYHLTADSPALDAGTADSAPKTDFDGTARPQGAAHDLGAYEQ